MNEEELRKAANDVLYIMLSEHDKKVGVRTDHPHIMYDQQLRENAIDIFRYIESKPSSFVYINQYSAYNQFTKPPLCAIIKPNWLNRIEPFLNAGGFEKYNDFTDYAKELNKPKESVPILPIIDNSKHVHNYGDGVVNIDTVNTDTKYEIKTHAKEKKKGFWDRLNTVTGGIVGVITISTLIVSFLGIRSCSNSGNKGQFPIQKIYIHDTFKPVQYTEPPQPIKSVKTIDKQSILDYPIIEVTNAPKFHLYENNSIIDSAIAKFEIQTKAQEYIHDVKAQFIYIYKKKGKLYALYNSFHNNDKHSGDNGNKDVFLKLLTDTPVPIEFRFYTEVSIKYDTFYFCLQIAFEDMPKKPIKKIYGRVPTKGNKMYPLNGSENYELQLYMENNGLWEDWTSKI